VNHNVEKNVENPVWNVLNLYGFNPLYKNHVETNPLVKWNHNVL
jgi:hypothetical protein